MQPANSYQDPSMTPPDGYDVAVDGQGNDLMCSTEGCNQYAVEQDNYDMRLCPDHLKDEAMWDMADNQNKSDREEYGQFETDSKGSY